MRDRVYDVIDSERDYQDANWPDTEGVGHSIGEYLLLFEEHIHNARAQWSKRGSEANKMATLNSMRKLAGITVRCMEEYGAIPREYHVPVSANITGQLDRKSCI